jgi:hypothetical protein
VNVLAEEYPKIKKESFDGKKVEILGETYEPGEQEFEKPYNWRDKVESRDEILKYLKSALRYWYSAEGYGSEKRKKPA